MSKFSPLTGRDHKDANIVFSSLKHQFLSLEWYFDPEKAF